MERPFVPTMPNLRAPKAPRMRGIVIHANAGRRMLAIETDSRVADDKIKHLFGPDYQPYEKGAKVVIEYYVRVNPQTMLPYGGWKIVGTWG